MPVALLPLPACPFASLAVAGWVAMTACCSGVFRPLFSAFRWQKSASCQHFSCAAMGSIYLYCNIYSANVVRLIETGRMQKKTIIGTLILIAALALSFIAFQPPVSQKSPACQKESGCPKKERDGKLIWENLSHQFFPSTPSSFTSGM